MPTVTNEYRQIHYRVRDLDAAVARYTHLRWFRAAAANGYYTALTAPTASPASAEARGVQYTLEDKLLEITVDGVHYEVLFSGPNPYTPADVQADITAVLGANISMSLVDDVLTLSSTTTGLGSSLEFGGDASIDLGLEDAVGLAADDYANFMQYLSPRSVSGRCCIYFA